MKSNLAPRAIFCLTVASFLTVGPIACGSKKSKPAEEASKASVLDEKSAACELRLRDQMETKKIQFKQDNTFPEQIARANESLTKPSDLTYLLRQVKDLNQAVRVEHVEKNQDALVGTAYTLSTNKKDSAQPLKLELYSMVKKGRTTEELRQHFFVDKECVLSVSETSLETLKENEGTFEHNRVSISSEGKEDHKAGSFKIPPTAKFENLTMPFESMDKVEDGSYYFNLSMGLVTVKVEPGEAVQVSKFDYELAMPSKKVQFLNSQGKSVGTVLLAEQPVLGVALKEKNGAKVWKVPKVAWAKQRLGTFETTETPAAAAAPAGAAAPPAAAAQPPGTAAQPAGTAAAAPATAQATGAPAATAPVAETAPPK
jgi:hypothetical protein